ncbi:hypothetical protein NC652_002463 [Populus alba x Populus x berolinensis]|nr:hypothetical protein NC652_002463 [Populus alba x Populus x berolinensis]
MEVIRVREVAFVSYLEQSTLGETVKGKVIPQLAGRDCANWGFGFICLEADLMQLQAACLSAVFTQGLRSLITSLQEIAASEGGVSKRNIMRAAIAAATTLGEFMAPEEPGCSEFAFLCVTYVVQLRLNILYYNTTNIFPYKWWCLWCLVHPMC